MERSTALIENNFNQREFSLDLLHEIICSTSAEQGTSDFVRNIYFPYGGKKTSGSFYPKERMLVIFPDVIETGYQQYLKRHYFNPHSQAIVSRYNFFFLDTGFHELTHAYQFKEALTYNNDTIHCILRDCYEKDLITDTKAKRVSNILYRFFNKDLLLERNADFNSLYTLLKKDEEACFLTKEDYIWIKRMLIEIALYGYTPKRTPVSRYYTLRREQDRYQRLPLNENYSLKDKLSWGLPVDFDTLAELYYESKQEDPNINLIMN